MKSLLSPRSAATLKRRQIVERKDKVKEAIEKNNFDNLGKDELVNLLTGRRTTYKNDFHDIGDLGKRVLAILDEKYSLDFRSSIELADAFGKRTGAYAHFLMKALAFAETDAEFAEIYGKWSRNECRGGRAKTLSKAWSKAKDKKDFELTLHSIVTSLNQK